MLASSTRFGPLTIAYDADVLEPRPWTIEQARWATELLAPHDGATRVLELCAGAGQIGLAVARATGCTLVQVDADERACHFARLNAATNDLATDVRCAHLADALEQGERFDVVLADPPYIPSDETDAHGDDPDDAIDGGPDGLALARTCVVVAASHLAPGGHVVLQLGGPEQAATLSGEAPSVGLDAIETRTYGADRALLLLRRA